MEAIVSEMHYRTDNEFSKARITRGGILSGRKSIAIVGRTVEMPALTDSDVQRYQVDWSDPDYDSSVS